MSFCSTNDDAAFPAAPVMCSPNCDPSQSRRFPRSSGKRARRRRNRRRQDAIPELSRRNPQTSYPGTRARAGRRTRRPTRRPWSKLSCKTPSPRSRSQIECLPVRSWLKKPSADYSVGRPIFRVSLTEEFPNIQMLTALAEVKKPAQNPMDKVQVKATPMNNRYRDALAGQSWAPTGSDRPRAVDVDCIPSSTSRRGQMEPPPSSRVECTPFINRIAATPARASAVPGRLLHPPGRNDVITTSSPMGPARARSSAKTVTALAPVAEDFVPGSSPLQPRKSTAVTQPAPPRSSRDEPASSTVSRTLFQTPLKAKAKTNAAQEQRGQSTPTRGAEKPLSIYQQLGWDEVDDL